MDTFLCVVLLEILKKLCLVTSCLPSWKIFFQELSVVLSPLLDRELRDCGSGAVALLSVDATSDFHLAFLPAVLDASFEARKPRSHLLKPLHTQITPQISYDLVRIEVGNRCSISSTDAVGTVDEHHGDDRTIPNRFNFEPLFVLIIENAVISLLENGSRHGCKACVDVTAGRCVLATLKPRSELALRYQEVHIVRTNEVLGHADDSVLERILAMVVRSVVHNISDELSHFHVFRQLPLETTKEHLSLTWLKAVDQTWDGADNVRS
mmetsp:Transcript_26793/g.70405  ORF Transcript_26793/g.70405 Transcript_26793/m.70405 type:complete len:266 (-) Transcript_26793:2139-2936(-)